MWIFPIWGGRRGGERDNQVDALESINAKTRQAYNLAAQRYHDLFHNEMNEKAYDRELLDSFADRFGENSVICDAGCGPSGHIGRYVADKGIRVVGVDISDKCVELARRHNPEMRFERGDIGNLWFDDGLFDGVISYYSIIDTPKRYVGRIFDEFHRVLKPNGTLLVAVKAGTTEGYLDDLLGIETEIYFALFTEKEITDYFEQAGFLLEFIETRNPYDFEISNERVFAIGKKV
jgi:SAM-dependent methyltransferase